MHGEGFSFRSMTTPTPSPSSATAPSEPGSKGLNEALKTVRHATEIFYLHVMYQLGAEQISHSNPMDMQSVLTALHREWGTASFARQCTLLEQAISADRYDTLRCVHADLFQFHATLEEYFAACSRRSALALSKGPTRKFTPAPSRITYEVKRRGRRTWARGQTDPRLRLVGSPSHLPARFSQSQGCLGFVLGRRELFSPLLLMIGLHWSSPSEAVWALRRHNAYYPEASAPCTSACLPPLWQKADTALHPETRLALSLCDEALTAYLAQHSGLGYFQGWSVYAHAAVRRRLLVRVPCALAPACGAARICPR